VACSCQLDPATGQLWYPDADVIFSGTVTSDAELTSIEIGNGPWPMFRFRVRADRYFKGRLGRDIDVITEDWRISDCGYRFERGERYLVYAAIHDGMLEVPFCSETAPLSAARELLSGLGEGTAPDRSLDVVREETAEENAGCSVSAPRANASPFAFLLGAALLLVASLRRR
jgi:hypothetical protein